MRYYVEGIHYPDMAFAEVIAERLYARYNKTKTIHITDENGSTVRSYNATREDKTRCNETTDMFGG